MCGSRRIAKPFRRSCADGRLALPFILSGLILVQISWWILYNAGADLVINGHAHNYERVSPQDPNCKADTVMGMREFIVGTGGAPLASFNSTAANSEVRNSSTFGVLKLTLHPTSYDWQFIPIVGQTFTDSGTQACH